MAKFDALLFDGEFAKGSASYLDSYRGHGDQNHIVITLALAGNQSLTIQAILDTGAKWCIIHPEIANEWNKHFYSHYDPGHKMNIRGYSYSGQIANADIVLLAKSGESLKVQAKFFIPQLADEEEWNYPNFVGLDGLINCMRFAIDPSENTIYFGGLS